MGMTDPIADMLTRIRNAIMVSYDAVDIPVSKLRINIGKVLKSEGFIRNYKIISNRQHGMIRIFLKYDENGESVITGLKRVSRPGRRVYTKSDRIPQVLDGYGINVLSTSKGIMTDRHARKLRVGGEILCSIW
jgi:small subunit ribosomal protein S8